VKYHLDMPFFTADFVWAMNKAKYEAMSASQRAVIDAHCTPSWAETIASPWADFEHAGHAKLEAMPGHEVYKISKEQVDLWRKAAGPLKAKWAAQVKTAGYDPDAVYDGLVEELKKHSALAE
jgi:TRAP-type transport system periplasmic protein